MDKMREIFTGAKASLLSGTSLSPQVRGELMNRRAYAKGRP